MKEYYKVINKVLFKVQVNTYWKAEWFDYKKEILDFINYVPLRNDQDERLGGDTYGA